MPERCVVFGCNNVRSKEKGILLHPISFYGKSESEKQKGRRKWIDFVKSLVPVSLQPGRGADKPRFKNS